MDNRQKIQHEIALIIYNKDKNKFLVKQVKTNKESYWVLPIGNYRKDTYNNEVKSNEEIEIIKQIAVSRIDVIKKIIRVSIFHAKIISGFEKFVKEGVYKWGTPKDLIYSAKKGVLCSQLLLDQLNYRWQERPNMINYQKSI